MGHLGWEQEHLEVRTCHFYPQLSSAPCAATYRSPGWSWMEAALGLPCTSGSAGDNGSNGWVPLPTPRGKSWANTAGEGQRRRGREWVSRVLPALEIQRSPWQLLLWHNVFTGRRKSELQPPLWCPWHLIHPYFLILRFSHVSWFIQYQSEVYVSQNSFFYYRRRKLQPLDLGCLTFTLTKDYIFEKL